MALIIIQILAILGFLLSFYALYIEKKYEKSKKYKSLCDISEKVSCTKAFSSKYGKLFGLSNSVYGMIFYLVILLLSFYNITYIFYLSMLAVIGSVYLAYVLYFKLNNFCLVCSGIYLVNIILLIFSYLEVY
ncbi:MAG: hypothetical protein IIA87_03865 [Nanoarchaeota archaeon]|nr:hypothetical protein [Nanoarchaeota archaeon]